MTISLSNCPKLSDNPRIKTVEYTVAGNRCSEQGASLAGQIEAIAVSLDETADESRTAIDSPDSYAAKSALFGFFCGTIWN